MSTAMEANGYDVDQLAAVVTVSKLSKLQRCILGLALENRVRENRNEDSRGADMYYAEVMVKHFGFKLARSRWTNRRPNVANLRENQGNQCFNREEVGRARYAAAAASISRAAQRLGHRGLVVCLQGAHSRWSGVSLTVEGVNAAASAKVRSAKAKAKRKAVAAAPARARRKKQ